MLKKILNLTGNSAFHSFLDNKLDSRYLFSFNTNINSILFADVCFIVGINTRISFPLLNAKIRQAYVKKNLPVYLLGYFSNFTFYCKHISTSDKVIINILEGSHWLSSKISKSNSKKPLLFVNSELGLSHTLLNLFKYTNLSSLD
jgi:NADH dehydrogenase/NADH:ubiquinone oxidoreductase subunit G